MPKGRRETDVWQGQHAAHKPETLWEERRLRRFGFYSLKPGKFQNPDKDQADVNATKGVDYSMPILYLVGRSYCILSAGLVGGLYALVEFCTLFVYREGQFTGPQ